MIYVVDSLVAKLAVHSPPGKIVLKSPKTRELQNCIIAVVHILLPQEEHMLCFHNLVVKEALVEALQFADHKLIRILRFILAAQEATRAAQAQPTHNRVEG